MNETEFETVEMMEQYGGSFVKALAECFHRADRNNIDKLKVAFADYWCEYSEKFRMSKSGSTPKTENN